MLMPIYNAAETLPETIDSLLKQSMPDFEIVAINDGSTDDTAAILHARAEEDTRIRPINLPHVGLIAALKPG